MNLVQSAAHLIRTYRTTFLLTVVFNFLAVFVVLRFSDTQRTQSPHAYSLQISLPANTTTLVLNVTLPSIPLNSMNYIRSVFILSGSQLRVTAIKMCKSKSRFSLALNGRGHTLQFITIQSTCPWFYAPKCDLTGYFGIGRFADGDLDQSKRDITIVDSSGEHHLVDVVDSRLTSVMRPHRLAVCLQPVYLLAHWPLIPHFFETWIAHGATLFYIYVQTIAPEIDSLLRIYEADKNITVVRVPWGPFPTDEEDASDANPNNLVYRTEVVTAVNDCVLRARGKARYVVSSDLDEIIVPLNPEVGLLELVDTWRTKAAPKNKKYGAFVFQQSFAHAETKWETLNHPTDLNFSAYTEVRVEDKIWPVGQRSKVIMVPEFVRRAHVHQVVQMEGPRWTIAVIPPTEALVFHFRQVESDAMEKEEHTSTVLATASQAWTRNWHDRISRAIDQTLNARTSAASPTADATPKPQGRPPEITDFKWPNRGLQVMSELDMCRRDFQANKQEKCGTQWACRRALQALDAAEWIVAPSSWVVV